MDKQQRVRFWRELREAWKTERASRADSRRYSCPDPVVFICLVAGRSGLDRDWVERALKDDGVDERGVGFCLPRRIIGWPFPALSTAAHTDNDRRLWWLDRQVNLAEAD